MEPNATLGALVLAGLVLVAAFSRLTAAGRRCPNRCDKGKLWRADGTFRWCRRCDGDGTITRRQPRG